MNDTDKSFVLTYNDCENCSSLLQEIASTYPDDSPEELSIRYATLAVFHQCYDQSAEAFFTARKNFPASLTGLEILMFLSNAYEIPQDFQSQKMKHLEKEIKDIVHKINCTYRKEKE